MHTHPHALVSRRGSDSPLRRPLSQGVRLHIKVNIGIGGNLRGAPGEVVISHDTSDWHTLLRFQSPIKTTVRAVFASCKLKRALSLKAAEYSQVEVRTSLGGDARRHANGSNASRLGNNDARVSACPLPNRVLKDVLGHLRGHANIN